MSFIFATEDAQSKNGVTIKAGTVAVVDETDDENFPKLLYRGTLLLLLTDFRLGNHTVWGEWYI
jgi:hypothetical protein